MAGFFGLFDYGKPGLGVPRNEPQKPRILIFWRVLRGKIWRLVQLNLLYVLFNIPAILLSVFCVTSFFITGSSLNPANGTSIRIFFSIILICIPLISIGPVQAGFIFVLKKYAEEKPAFLWSDFKDNAVKNIKQSMIICFINLVVTIMIGINIILYTRVIDFGVFSFALEIIFSVFILLFIMMQFYIYPMLVTYKLSVKDLYKNAFMLSFARFIPNLLMLGLCLLIIYVTFLFLYIGVLLFILITPSIIGLILNFYSIPYLNKYVADNSASSFP